jgi:hypothetical protein
MNESLISTKADWTTASRLAALAQAMTVLACGGYMLEYRSVELRIRYVGLGGA